MFQSLKKYLSPSQQLVLGFFIIFIFHLAFKSLFLDHAGFWYDETFGLWYSQQDWGLIKHTSEWDLNPPFYYYFLWVWRNLFGISEFSIRFSSVLFSSLSAGMIYAFSAKYFNRLTAIVAALIFTSSSNFLFFAHEARCYSMVTFFALCSSWFYFKLLAEKNMYSAIFLGIINFLLIYTHYLSGFILIFQVFLAVIVCKKQFLKHFGIAIAVTLLLSFWRFTAKTIDLILHHEKSFWLTTSSLYDLKNAFCDFFNNREILFLYIVLTGLALGYLIFKKRILILWQGNKIKYLYLLLCGLITIFLCFLISLKIPLFLMRYLLFASPFIYILIGFIISELPGKARAVAATSVCLVSLYAFSGLQFKTPKPMNFKDAMPVIKKLQSPSTLILVETRDIGPLFAYYYDKNAFADYYNMQARLNSENVYFVSSPDDVKAIDLQKYDKVILTQTFEKLNPNNEALLTFLRSKYRQRSSVSYYNEVNILAFIK